MSPAAVLRHRSLLLAALLAVAPAAKGQAAPRADSVAGKWQAGGGAPHGTLRMILDLVQVGDSLTGTALMEKDGMPTDTQADLIGTIHDGKLDLHARYEGLRMTGTLRRDVIRARVVPGRYKEASAFEATFTRVQ